MPVTDWLVEPPCFIEGKTVLEQFALPGARAARVSIDETLSSAWRGRGDHFASCSRGHMIDQAQSFPVCPAEGESGAEMQHVPWLFCPLNPDPSPLAILCSKTGKY